MKGLLTLLGLIIFYLIYGAYPKYTKIIRGFVFCGSTLFSVMSIIRMFVKYASCIDLKILFVIGIVLALVIIFSEVFPRYPDRHEERREKVSFGIDSILFINSIIIIVVVVMGSWWKVTFLE